MQSDQRFFLRIAIWLSAICFFCTSFVSAQDGTTGEPPRIVAVRVVTESGSVLEQDPPQLTAQRGQPFSMASESESLRELFRSGRFADLRAALAISVYPRAAFLKIGKVPLRSVQVHPAALLGRFKLRK